MILTGAAIEDAVSAGDIVIDPFLAEQLNPNSYNYRLGDVFKRVVVRVKDVEMSYELEDIPLARGRILLRKGQLYLGHTLERIGSHRYVTSLIGRSSVGRLGLFLQVSANIGHQGAVHRWTLELFAAQDIYLYAGQTIGQVSFWVTEGASLLYSGWYGRHNDPVLSKLHFLSRDCEI